MSSKGPSAGDKADTFMRDWYRRAGWCETHQRFDGRQSAGCRFDLTAPPIDHERQLMLPLAKKEDRP